MLKDASGKPLPSARNDKRFARSRERDVGEAPLFFEIEWVHAVADGKEPVLEADEVDRSELHSLRGVDRHHPHFIPAAYGRLVGEERHDMKVARQGRRIAIFPRLRLVGCDRREHFVDVS